MAAAIRSDMRRRGLWSGHSPRSHSLCRGLGPATTRLMPLASASTVHRQKAGGVGTFRLPRRDYGRGAAGRERRLRLGYTLTGQRREAGSGRVLHPEITLLPAQ
jgi:hypothetical protein